MPVAPALEASADGPLPIWLPPSAGFLLGAGGLWALDKLVPHLHLFATNGSCRGTFDCLASVGPAGDCDYAAQRS
jgi:hypothetical protein